MNKVICDVCGTDYPETAAQCPICGCARADGGQTSAGNAVPGEEEKTAYTYVKGGRFSKSNVRKRLKASQTQEIQRPEPEYDDEDEEDEANQVDDEQEVPASNRGLIAIVILLLLAIIAVSSYIAIEFFGLGSDKDSGTTKSTASYQSTADSAADTTVGNPVPCTNLTVSDSEIILTGFDTSWLLNVSVEPADTTDALLFVTSDDNVVAVDQDGNVTAVGEGEATVTVTCGQFIAECKVICDFEDAPVDPSGSSEPTDPSDASDPSDPTQPSESGTDVVLKLRYEDVTLDKVIPQLQLYSGELDPSAITWSSSKENIAVVENGLVTPVSLGSTLITAEYEGQKATCWIRVTQAALDALEGQNPTQSTEPSEPSEPSESSEPTEPGEKYSIMINGKTPAYRIGDDMNSASVTLHAGDSITLTVESELGARMEVEWTISNSAVCSVDGRKVIALASGNATLTATYEGQTFTCQIIVV